MAESSPASELFKRPCSSASARARSRARDGVGQLVERALLGAQHHGLHVAQRDAPTPQRVEQQLLQLRRDQHHIRAQRVHQLAGRIRFHANTLLLRGCRNPAHCVVLVHPRQFHHAAVLAQRLGQPLEAILVVHLHAPRVGRDAHKIGDKKKQRLRVGRLEIAVQRGKLVFLGAASVKLLHIADEDHLKRRHQRRSLRAVQHLEYRGRGKFEIRKTKIPQIRLYKCLENGRAAAVQKKCLVAGQHVAGLERPFTGSRGLDLRHKAAGRGESSAPARAAHCLDPRFINAKSMRLQNTPPAAPRPAAICPNAALFPIS